MQINNRYVNRLIYQSCRLLRELTDTSRTFAEAVDRTDSDNDETHITIAVVVGLYENTSKAMLADGSTADARRNIEIHAKTEYPFRPTYEANNETGKVLHG